MGTTVLTRGACNLTASAVFTLSLKTLMNLGRIVDHAIAVLAPQTGRSTYSMSCRFPCRYSAGAKNSRRAKVILPPCDDDSVDPIRNQKTLRQTWNKLLHCVSGGSLLKCKHPPHAIITRASLYVQKQVTFDPSPPHAFRVCTSMRNASALWISQPGSWWKCCGEGSCVFYVFPLMYVCIYVYMSALWQRLGSINTN